MGISQSIGETILITFVRKRKNIKTRPQNISNLSLRKRDWKKLQKKNETKQIK